jgi:tetratricopeptide (TPR) repeat protein
MRFLISFFLFSLSLFSLAQSPFTRVRHGLSSDNHESSRTILDSCNAKAFYKDSVFYYKGLVALKAGNIKEAKRNSASLSRMYPEFQLVRYLRAMIFYNLENYGRSISEFNVVIKNDPKNIKALYNRSLALGVLGNYNSAIDDLNHCIVLNSNYAQAYYAKAYWYEFLQNYEEAVKDYHSVIKLEPKNFDAYFGMAYCYQKLNLSDKACETMSNASENGSQIAEDLKEGYCR